jgi:hypothetical protein
VNSHVMTANASVSAPVSFYLLPAFGAGEYLVAESSRVNPYRVKPNSRAVSTASEVGADTATTAEILAAIAF